MLAAGCGTKQTAVTSESTIDFPTKFSNCTFVGNVALEEGGAIEIAIGRFHVDNSTFVGNIANTGGALRLFGTAELFNSTFSENMSGEGAGSAISNVGIISEMIGLGFSANRFTCDAAEFVGFIEVRALPAGV